MTSRRLPSGGRIDRTVAMPFTWDGKSLNGHHGDTLAVALLANDVRLVGRSFKYHRPRGVMSAGVEESGALVTIGRGAHRDPNVKATMQELYPGLIAASQNAWPNTRIDIGALANLFGRFLPAGFYYKTFMGPRIKSGGTAVWMQCEKIIRRAAGMGKASRLPDPDLYEHAHDFCDVLIVGAGVAGLSAAATAARAGLEVLLVEQEPEPGGDLLSQPTNNSQTKLTQLLTEAREAGVRTMTRTTAFGLYDCGVAGLLERVTDHLANPDSSLPRQRFWTVRARYTIIAAGALERSLAFGNNDRPGVMTAAAGRTYLNRYGVLPGERIVIATNNDSAYPTATELADAGADVTLLDARATIGDALQRLAGDHDVTIRLAHAPLKVIGGQAARALDMAFNGASDGAADDGADWQYRAREVCDLVLVSGGWSPTIHLNSHRGTRPVWNAKLACFLPGETAEPILTVGSAAGIWNGDACEASGKAAGFAVAKMLGAAAKTLRTNHIQTSDKDTADIQAGGWHNPIRPLYEIRVSGRKLKSLVDPQNDVTADDVRLAHREGFVSVEHLKRYTTLGMSTDGGKMGNVIGLAIMAEALGKEISEVGSTVFRPPYTPVSIGALRGRSVGRHFRPLRRTPMHQWNLDHGAVMTMAGLWHRPWYFPTMRKNSNAQNHDQQHEQTESIAQAYLREATTVRTTVGLCDVTSLGKIAIQGPDATEFLNRIYTNPFAKLSIGKARYGIMLRDDGVVMDDGTAWRLSETDYFMTTTTAHAAKVMAWLEELLQTRWQHLKVQVTSVSDQWAGCAVAGPQSRATLEGVLGGSMDARAMMSDQSLPFMGVCEATLKGDIPCRIARISFSGEMAFEVYVPSDYAVAMMDLLWASAKPHRGCLYGLEALGALRIEKGHVTAAELDGRITIDDAGLGAMASPNKSFIGSALRKRPELLRKDRPQLVGIIPKNRGDTFNAGAILCGAGHASGHTSELGDGWITAVTESPVLGHWIGIGFIAGGHSAWNDKSVIAADPVRMAKTEVEIISPHMVDPDGERMHG